MTEAMRRIDAIAATPASPLTARHCALRADSSDLNDSELSTMASELSSPSKGRPWRGRRTQWPEFEAEFVAKRSLMESPYLGRIRRRGCAWNPPLAEGEEMHTPIADGRGAFSVGKYERLVAAENGWRRFS
jgi:hypothetical protein